jgi:hypothetical protein
MKRKIIIVLSLVLLVFAGCFIYLKYFLLKARDVKPDNSKAMSIIDLRPSIIAKLQQLVKDGSNGSYILSIEKINPDIVASTLDVFDVNLRVDSVVMQQLDRQKKLPDDIFKIHFDSLHIDGIGLDYLLHSRRIDITGANISKPSIEVYHRSRPYNQAERKRNDTMSLYHQIKEQMNSIRVGHINIANGTLITYDGPHQKNISKLNDVNIRISDLLVDSSTQYDASRTLFAKELDIDAKDYVVFTADSLYYFKTGFLSISAVQHKTVLQDVEFNPRGNKEQFEKKLTHRQGMHHLLFKKVEFTDVDWWSMINRDRFMAKEGTITGGFFIEYFDKSLPEDSSLQLANFPQQILMGLNIPVAVDHLVLKDVDIAYEEFNPAAKGGATAYFDKMNGQFDHISNIPSGIQQHPVIDFSGNAMFMHHVPIKASFTFNLAKHRTGEFTADIHMDALDKETANLLAVPLGLFLVKSGEMQAGDIHIEGNDLTAKSKLAISYTDLHVDPLKKADEKGRLKKKRATTIIANVFLIKNSNPAKGQALRQPEYTVVRDHRSNFFSMLWIATVTGMLKTMGVPVKLVVH